MADLEPVAICKRQDIGQSELLQAWMSMTATAPEEPLAVRIWCCEASCQTPHSFPLHNTPCTTHNALGM